MTEPLSVVDAVGNDGPKVSHAVHVRRFADGRGATIGLR